MKGMRMRWRSSGGDHTIVPQQRVDSRFAAAKRLERFERRTAAADGEDLVAEARTGPGVEHALLLEQAVGVGREHFGPLVAVVAGRVATGEDMREIVQEAVVSGRDRNGDLRPDFLQQLKRRLCSLRVVVVVQVHVDQREDRKSTRLNSSHVRISYAVFCL